ncbi:hypothetical protein ACFFK0_22315 [Paenibacillus chartarius]|uniref:YkoP-like domain-containing protein n=1 Tax=Paenibacillus chartarius TaxID=747481 RepID=A0ABV6DR63_9BACL
MHVKLSRRKRWMVGAWLTWERLFHTWFGVKPIDSASPLFYYRVCKYKGQDIVFPDHERIVSGDKVVELHFNNRMLVGLGVELPSIVQLAARLIHDTKHILPVIAERMETEPEFAGAKGVYGITMIHRGTQRLGFTVLDLPAGMFRMMTQIYLTALLYVIHPEGKERSQTSKVRFEPKLLAISAKQLMQQKNEHVRR